MATEVDMGRINQRVAASEDGTLTPADDRMRQREYCGWERCCIGKASGVDTLTRMNVTRGRSGRACTANHA